MKKSLLLMLVGFLAVLLLAIDSPSVFAGAVTTGADTVMIDGHIRVMGGYRASLDFNEEDGRAEKAKIEERIRLGVGADVTPGVKFYVQLERYNDFGTTDALSSTEAGSPNWRFAWIDFAIPETPINLKLGRQPLSYGYGITFDSTEYGADALQAYGKFNGVKASLVAVKLRESDATTPGKDDDRNLYALSLSFEPREGHSLELYLLNHRDNNTPVAAATFTSARDNAEGITGGGADEYTLGLAWMAKYGALMPKAEVAWQTGTAYTRASDMKDIDRSAWAIRASIDYDVDIWTIGLDFGYGTGNDKAPTVTDFTKDKGFYQPYYVDGGRWLMPTDLGNPGSFTLGDGTTSRKFTFTGLNNVWFLTLEGKAAVTKTWTLQADLTYVNAVKTYDGMGGISGKPDKELGWEASGRATWKPYKNLDIIGYIGWFFPGDYFTDKVTNAKDDNAFIARAEAIVTF